MGPSSTATASENRSKYSRLSFAAVPLPQRGRLIKGNPKRIIDQDGCAKRAFPAGEGGRQIVKSSATLFRDEIQGGKVIKAFTRTRVDEMNNTQQIIFRN